MGTPILLVPTVAPEPLGEYVITLSEAYQLMNWSRSVVVFSGGGARAHPPGVAPEASVECLDSSEVFYMFYWGIVLICCVIHVFSFVVWFVAVEPPSLVRTGSIRVSAVFYRSTLTLLL
jgi:hypothetical protein